MVRTVLVGGVQIRIETDPNQEVCYEALRPGVVHMHTALRACVKHLRAREIAFVIATRHTRQQMIAGLTGKRVAKMFVQLTPRRTWAPKRRNGAFFGYVPVGYTILAVVKVLDDGTHRSFAVRPTG
jgi:hypothetical protein